MPFQKYTEIVDKIFNFIKNTLYLKSLMTIALVLFLSSILYRDLFYVVLLSYVEEKLPHSETLKSYLTKQRIDNFNGHSELEMRLMPFKNTVDDLDKEKSPWHYNQSIVHENLHKIDESNMTREMKINYHLFFRDMDEYYFNLTNGNYSFKKEQAFNELRILMKKYQCKLYDKNHQHLWSTIVVIPVYGMVVDTLLYSQALNYDDFEKLSEKSILNSEITIGSSYGYNFLSLLFPEQCDDSIYKIK